MVSHFYHVHKKCSSLQSLDVSVISDVYIALYFLVLLATGFEYQNKRCCHVRVQELESPFHDTAQGTTATLDGKKMS